jgi:predicted nuclease of predicted toxin-antitoxin system
MLLLIDENVPDSVARFFAERGHDVHLVRDLFPSATPDPVIAKLGDELAAIVVTWNHKHFKTLASRVPSSESARFKRLGRISFRCNETHGRRRAEELIESIEFEYSLVQKRRDKRLIMEISETTFNVIR